MGLLYKILAAPVRGPIQGALWIAQQVAEQAYNELYDPDRIRGELAELELAYDLGEIGDDDYAQMEDALLQRLSEAQAAAAE